MRKIFSIYFILVCTTIQGQSIRELLKFAETNYPLLKSKGYEALASHDYVTSARSSMLPTLDAAYQVNYATFNNITGMATTQYFVPISGPPSTANTNNAVFGSAASLLMNWDILTFGQRSSKVDLARTRAIYSEADQRNEVFRHKVIVVQTYLDLLFAYELTDVYQKNLERSIENNKVVRTLAASGLRPGVDTALFIAELARAKIELLTHKKVVESQRIAMKELLATDQLSVTDTVFFNKLPSMSDSTSVVHPLLQLSAARLEVNRSQRTTVLRTLYPKLSLWGTAYARGSGVNYNGEINSKEGLTFSRYNYGVGVQFVLPLLKFFDTRPQLQAQNNMIKAQEEQLVYIHGQLHKEAEIAEVTFDNAMEVAHESPSFFNAAKFSYDALLTRYNAGLANYADLVQAQYGLLKAEADLKRSYLETWKALLLKAAVLGDLEIFLNQIDGR
jgi:outer membrane protein